MAEDYDELVHRIGHYFLLDLKEKVLFCEDEPINLTSAEYLVLECLVQHRGQTCTREMIRDHLYGGDDKPDSNVIDSFVYKLRKKFSAVDPQGAQYIVAVRGQGYSLK